MKMLDRLDRDLQEMNCDLEIDEIIDSHAAHIRIFAPEGKQWVSSGTNCISHSYGSTASKWIREAVDNARADMELGTEDASKETIYAMGW